MPWQKQNEGLEYLNQKGAPPVEKFGFERYQEWSANIRIVHDGTPSNFSNVKSKIENAERVFYLGFGFAPENLEIIKPNKNPDKLQKIYGTAYELTEKQINDIRTNLFPDEKGVHPQPQIDNKDCYKLLREYL